MKLSKYIFIVFFCLPILFVNAQTRLFEFNNPNARVLNDKSLEMLTSGYWRVYKEDLENIGTIRSIKKNTSICYYPDGTFFYNGSTGTWEVLDDRYIVHEWDKEAEEDLNFGGIFAATEMTESSLILTKLLTSSNDMKRTLYLKPSTTLTKIKQTKSGIPYRYDGPMETATLDSISRMDPDQLFDAGFNLLQDSIIHIMTPDTMYIIRLNAIENKYMRVPLP